MMFTQAGDVYFTDDDHFIMIFGKNSIVDNVWKRKEGNVRFGQGLTGVESEMDRDFISAEKRGAEKK